MEGFNIHEGEGMVVFWIGYWDSVSYNIVVIIIRRRHSTCSFGCKEQPEWREFMVPFRYRCYDSLLRVNCLSSAGLRYHIIVKYIYCT